MKIELKNVKIAAFMSEETTAFTATVYVDGKKAFEAYNHGQGGPTGYHPFPGGEDLLRKAEAYAETLPPVDTDFKWFGEPIPYNLEWLIEDLLTAHEEEKRIRRLCRKSMVYTTPDCKKGEVFVTKRPYSPEFAAWIKAKHPEAVILNEQYC
jgi:hypothetical protein